MLQAELAGARVAVHAVRAGLLRKVTGGSKPPGWLAVAVLPTEAAADDPYGDFAVVCEQVADPGNLGTVVRAARALGVRDIVLTDEMTDLSSRRAMEAARGAVLGCRVRRFANPGRAIESLRASGFQIVATSPRGTHLQSMVPLTRAKVALVVGNETSGVSDASMSAADVVVQIPMAGAMESLNVGVATGISIYELRMRMIFAMLTDRIRDTLGRNLNAAGQLVREAFDARLREVGDLDAAQVVLLMVLVCDRNTPLDQLGRDIGAGHAEMRELLTALQSRGYMTSTSESAAITSKGERAVAALWAIQERLEDELYADFSPAEREQLRDMLRRLQKNAARLARSADR
jgi:RNA methyltransferase, TrmH family